MGRSANKSSASDDPEALKRKIQQLEDECARLRGETRGPDEKTAAFYKRIAGILDLSADSIISVDNRGLVQRFNRGAEKMFGYRSSEIIGRPLDILIPEKYRKAHRGHLAEFAKTSDDSRQMNERGEIFGLRKDGGEFPAEASIARLEVSGRQVLSVILRDVSERKAAERALRERESQLTQAQRLARLGTFVWDEVTGRCIHCSAEMASLFAMSAEEFVKRRGTIRKYLRFVHPDDRDRVERIFADASKKITPYDFEYRVYDDGGDLVYLREIGEPVLDATGRQVKTFGTMQDVTAFRLAQEAQRESEQQIRTITDNLPVFISYTDRDERLRFANKTVEQWYARPAAEILGKTVKSLVSEKTYARLRPDIKQVLSGKNRQFEEMRDFPDGASRYIEATYVPDFGEDGKARGWFTLLQDISVRKLAESAVKQGMRSAELRRRIATAANEADSVDQAIKFCIDEFCDHTGWPVGHAFRLAGDGSGELVSAKIWRLDDPQRFKEFRTVTERFRFAEGKGMPGRMVATGEPAWIADVKTDASFLRLGNTGDLGVRAAFGFPVLVDGRTVAVLEFFAAEPQPEDPLLMDVAAQAGNILGRVIERRRAEQALRDSERQMRLITDNLPVYIAYVDKDERFRFINKTAERWYKLSAAEVAGKSVPEVIGEDAYATMQPHLRTALSGEGVNLEVRRDFKDGSNRVIDLIYVPDFDEQDQVRGLFVLLNDVTARKKAEQALRENEKLIRTITDNLPAFIAYADKDERYRFVNQTAENWYALPAGEIIGRTLREMIGDAAYAEIRPRLETALAGKGVNFEMSRTLPDGSFRHMDVTYVPDFDDEGRVRGLFTLVNDMSDRIQAEEQLRQAQKMEAVGKLTGGVAHDFNNLLAVILGNAELLREKLGDGDPAIEAVTRASRRGAELTQRLLSFSRQLPLQPAAVGITDLVADMAGMLRRTLGETIAIETRSGKDLWQAHADPGQLENAILNIAINAQHAMPDGGALRIEIDNTTIDEETADRLDDAIPGEFVVLSITDTGHGIPPDALPRVFEPFFTTKEVGEGSGLGLSMVYGFVRQSGGFVAIESIAGHGTKVSLYLPRAHDRKPAEERPPDTAESESNGETILVVEDDRDVRAMTVTLLESLGYKVFWAADGESAHSVLQREDHIDLLLSDVVLPGDVSGPKIAEAALRRRPELKVLFMSGYAEDVVRRQASGSASDIDLLPKPFRRGDLARKVRETIERGAAGTA